MNPKQLKYARVKVLKMTQSQLAEALRIGGDQWAYKTIMKYERGHHPIPGPVAVAVEYMVKHGPL